MNFAFLRSRDFLAYWLPPLAWCGVILCLSGTLGSSQNTFGILRWLLSWFPPLSPAQVELIHFYFRKTVGHFSNYAFLYFLWFRAFRGPSGSPPQLSWLWSLGLCLVLALLDEGHQALVPGRTSSFRDVALDLAGASTAALIAALWLTFRERPAEDQKLLDLSGKK